MQGQGEGLQPCTGDGQEAGLLPQPQHKRMGFSIGSCRTVTLVPLTVPSNNEKRTFSSDNDTNLLGLVTEIMKNAFPPLFKVIAVKRDLLCGFFFIFFLLV